MAEPAPFIPERILERAELHQIRIDPDYHIPLNIPASELPNQNQVVLQYGRRVLAECDETLASGARLIAEAESDEALARLGKIQLEEIQTLVSKIDALCDPVQFDKVLGDITSTMGTLAQIIRARGDRIDAKREIPFDDYDFHTPNGLKEKECDNLVEEILSAYGHKNYGETLAERRNIRFSRWNDGYVPESVKKLVAMRSVRRDADLDAKHAAPIIQSAQSEIDDHIAIRENKALRRLFDQEDAPQPQKILQIAADEKLIPHSPLLTRLSLLISDYLQRQQSLALLLPLKTPLQDFQKSWNTLVLARQGELREAEALRLEQMRAEKWGSVFYDERSMKKALFSAASNSEQGPALTQTARELVRYASEGDKDQFVEALLTLSNQREFALAFIKAEVVALERKITARADEALDECLARFPRLARLASALRTSSNGEAQHHWTTLSLASGAPSRDGADNHIHHFRNLFSNRNFPAWMVSWYEHLETQISAGRAHPVERLSENCAAFGRHWGQKIPHLPAISVNGDRLHRGTPDDL